MGSRVATVSKRLRRLPIIVVPGIMGSRLTDPATGDLVWNPTGVLPSEPGSFAANTARLTNVSADLIPDKTHKFPQVLDRERVRPIRHYYTVITNFYGDLALALHYQLRKRLAPNRVPVVYCCGYDWRQDNRKSADLLSKVVNEAQEECDGERVVIVAHSMGGLVARHFCRNMGGESKVSMMFLLGSPSLGAIKAYHDMRNGLPFLDSIRRVLNLSNADTRTFMRDMQSVYQLLPNSIFCSRVRSDWAQFDGTRTGLTTPPPIPVAALQFSDVSNNALFYLDIYTGLRDEPTTRRQVERELGLASQFHAALTVGQNIYIHPRSVSYFAGDVATSGIMRLAFDGVTQRGSELVVVSRTQQVATIGGDGTVPTESASPQFTTVGFQETVEFPGVDHVSLSSNSTVINRLLTHITNNASAI